jgi:predicted  nucleic acid-binding Zn-ribbon protein
MDEKNMLKTAVTSAIQQKESLESQIAALNQDYSVLVNESVNLRNQVWTMSPKTNCTREDID